jgi:hypothetical protein
MMVNEQPHRADSNQAEIVKALRKAGCSVLILSQVGGGVPDLLVGFMDVLDRFNLLLEVKSPDGRLSSEQKIWHEGWKGPRPIVVRSIDEALEAVGKKRRKNETEN